MRFWPFIAPLLNAARTARRAVPTTVWAMAALCVFVGLRLNAQVPPDFPALTVTTYETNAVGAGHIFLEVTDAGTNGVHYVMILKNDGTPVAYQKTTNQNFDFKMLPDGHLHRADVFHPHSWTDGGDATHEILDAGFNPVETITAGNGYVADAHDFQLLPNGHVLLNGRYQTEMDLRPYVAGGRSDALVGGTILQELDAARNVVFQWRSWDHFTVPAYFPSAAFTNGTLTNQVIDAFQVNTEIMDTDGNLLVSNFGMDVWKINRQTGEILWRLGGPANQFSFVGVNPQEALGHFSGHTLSRLDNGNLLIYCNADQSATRSSKVYEYQLDETNHVATLIWSYTPATNCYAWHYGSAQRLANGNTFIGWGAADIVPGLGGSTNQWIPACTEVAPDGHVVFQMRFNDPQIASYRAYRFVYPPDEQAVYGSVAGPTGGNSYDFVPTGVSINVGDADGVYTSLLLTREPLAPLNPQFAGPAPRVLPLRLSVTGSGISTLQAEWDFDAVSFGFADPASLTVYYRPQAGQGVFQPQTTAYNPVTKKVAVALTILSPDYFNFGEFIFGQPDIAGVPYPPILAAVESYRGVQTQDVVGPLPAAPGTNYPVNQQLPVSLAWSPRGLAAGYQIQIATNADFSNPVVDVPDQTVAFLVWSNAAPGTAYYYRVNTTNDGGTGGWSAGAFQTVPGSLRITGIRQNPDGSWVLEWSGTAVPVYVEFNPTLAPGAWQTVAGPVSGSAWTNTPPSPPKGFYRLRLQ